MTVGKPVLQIDYTNHSSGAHDWRAEHCLKVIFGQVFESFEPRIVRCTGGQSYGLPVLRHPTSYPLSYLNSYLVHKVRVRVFRSPHDQVVSFENVDKTRVAGDYA